MTQQRFYRFSHNENTGSLELQCFNQPSLYTAQRFNTVDAALAHFVGECDESRNNALLLASECDKNILEAKRLAKEHKEAEVMQLPKILYGVQDGLWLTKYGIEWLEPGIVRVVAGGVLYDVVRLNTDSSAIEQLAIRGFFATPELAIERAKVRIDRELELFKKRNQD